MLYEMNLTAEEMRRLEMINAKKGVSFRTEEDLLLSKKANPVAESSTDEISAAVSDSVLSNHW